MSDSKAKDQKPGPSKRAVVNKAPPPAPPVKTPKTTTLPRDETSKSMNSYVSELLILLIASIIFIACDFLSINVFPFLIIAISLGTLAIDYKYRFTFEQEKNWPCCLPSFSDQKARYNLNILFLLSIIGLMYINASDLETVSGNDQRKRMLTYKGFQSTFRGGRGNDFAYFVATTGQIAVCRTVGYELGILFRYSVHLLATEFVYILLVSVLGIPINGQLFVNACLIVISIQTVLVDHSVITTLPSMIVQTLRVWINLIMVWLTCSLLSFNNRHSCPANKYCTAEELESKLGSTLTVIIAIVALYFSNMACLGIFRAIHNFGILLLNCVIELRNTIQSFL